MKPPGFEPGVPSLAVNPPTKIEPDSVLQFALVTEKVGVIGGGWVIDIEVEVWQLL